MAREPQNEHRPPTWRQPSDQPMEPPAAAREPVQPSKAGGTVVVACKLPHGLVLQTFSAVENHVPVMGGGTRLEVTHHAGPESYTVFGNSHPQNRGPRAVLVDSSGFALTWGIPKDFWDKWLSQNKMSDLVRKKLIYAHEDQKMVEGHAREYATQESGLERIDPNKPGRGIAKSDEQRHRAA